MLILKVSYTFPNPNNVYLSKNNLIPTRYALHLSSRDKGKNNWTTFGSAFTVRSGEKNNPKISKRWISIQKLKVSNTPSKTQQFFNKTLVKTIGPH